MGKIVGIDLGTTNSLVAVVDSGIPYVIADTQGQRSLPSVVHYPESGEPIVGHEARRQTVLKPASTLSSIKRFIGRRLADCPEDTTSTPFPLTSTETGDVRIGVHDKSLAPEDVSAEILKNLKDTATTSLEDEVTRAVITVPAYFNNAQRDATKRAGELAGLTVERIINEPTAAALAYGLDRLKEKSRIAVYDLGGGTFDLSILELTEGSFQVLSTNGNTSLGGDDIDRALSEFIAQKIAQSTGPDAASDPLLQAKINEQAEAAKIRLSSESEATISLPFITSDFSFEYALTRDELEKLAQPTVQQTRQHCIRALADAKLEAKDLDQVILVGGMTRMPLVSRFVGEQFGCSDFEENRGGIRIGEEYHTTDGPMLNTSINPDEAIALGAAIQGEILSGGFQNMLLLDVTPLSLGLETFGGLMNVIIPRNSTIPTKAGEMFTTAVDNQPSMLIHVLQGEREKAKDNWSIGKFTIEFQKAQKGVPRVGVQFEIDANGILHVLARDTHTGKEKIVDMQSAVDVDDEDVQQMVEESVEHAFDDLRSRQWIEAKLRATETIKATNKGIEDVGDDLDEEDAETIQTALSKVTNILAEEDPETETGDAVKLKEAIKELDQATVLLADLMMDKAMEAMLRKQGLIQ